MSVGFPPLPVYPRAIDSDRTLFLVYNTSETVITYDNQPWSENIAIQPVPANAPEIWADNGFANLNGELLYYDLVSYDANGKVCAFHRCARNLGGHHTSFNPAGTPIRGFVVAEHHAQLVTAIELIESFIGINFSPDESTLDWRIRNLNETPIIFDDFACPDVDFTFNIVSSNPSSGITASYNIQIQGTFANFTLAFGDGTSVTNQTTGTHVYAVNATVDPVITFTNGNCQIVQTPITRSISEQPQPTLPPVFDIPALAPFNPPPINIQPFSIPEPNINLPPIVPPCNNFNISGTIPSVISIQGPNPPIPSTISINQPSFPSMISINQPSFPSNIPICVPPGTSIPIDASSLLGISIPINPAALMSAKIGIDPSAIMSNKLKIDWSGAPVLSVQILCPGQQPSCPSMSVSGGMGYMPLMTGDPFAAPPTEDLDVQYDVVGFPTEIRLVPPDNIRLMHDLPDKIRMEIPEIPNININVPRIPDIVIDAKDIPTSIKLDTTDLPKRIHIELDIPKQIQLVSELKIPDRIEIDGSSIPETISVTGIPSTIRIEHTIPEVITVKLAEETKKLFEQGLPPVTLKLASTELIDQLESTQCFALVPCKRGG